VALRAKPDVLAFDEGAGTGQAACLAAALVAAQGAGAGLPTCLRDLGVRPGGVLRVPGDWPRRR
jgi:hypothetical protein